MLSWHPSCMLFVCLHACLLTLASSLACMRWWTAVPAISSYNTPWDAAAHPVSFLSTFHPPPDVWPQPQPFHFDPVPSQPAQGFHPPPQSHPILFPYSQPLPLFSAQPASNRRFECSTPRGYYDNASSLGYDEPFSPSAHNIVEAPVDVHWVWAPGTSLEDSGVSPRQGILAMRNDQTVLQGSGYAESLDHERKRRAYLHTPYPMDLRLEALYNRIRSGETQAQESTPFIQNAEVSPAVQLTTFGLDSTEEYIVWGVSLRVFCVVFSAKGIGVVSM